MTRSGVAFAAFGLALLVLPGSVLLVNAPAAAGPAPCIVSASLPVRAYVGEQVVLRRRVLRRPEVVSATWISAADFPGFRADALPGVPGERRVQQGGAAYLVFEERHALFPVHPGRLEIPPARLQCTLHAPPGQRPTAVVVTLAPLFLDVAEPPVAGRPTDWSGLVGDVQVAAQAAPRRLVLGSSLHFSVSFEGGADVRDAAPPFADASQVDGADLFAARPVSGSDPGERLRLWRTFSFDLVPRAVGTFTLPAVRAPYFDPRTGRYGVAASDPVEIQVEAPRGP